MGWYSFFACNRNCDIFTVISEGYDRQNALENARLFLKRDPENPNWDVFVSDSDPCEEYFRIIKVDCNGQISDNWERFYSSHPADVLARAEFTDLSKPVDDDPDNPYAHSCSANADADGYCKICGAVIPGSFADYELTGCDPV